MLCCPVKFGYSCCRVCFRSGLCAHHQYHVDAITRGAPLNSPVIIRGFDFGRPYRVDTNPVVEAENQAALGMSYLAEYGTGHDYGSDSD